jgi:hypothetical protein
LRSTLQAAVEGLVTTAFSTSAIASISAAAQLEGRADDLAHAAVDRSVEIPPAVLGPPDRGRIEVPELVGPPDSPIPRMRRRCGAVWRSCTGSTPSGEASAKAVGLGLAQNR